jgi:hypothetical protein
VPTDRDYVNLLSTLALGGNSYAQVDPVAFVAALDSQQRESLLETAASHHVVLRALAVLAEDAERCGHAEVANWATLAMAQEESRIEHALPFLDRICRELNEGDCPATVIKSLDHWPDLGSDLDLYTTADQRTVVRLMTAKFQTKVEPRSWGDRLAHKWNFAVAGLPESVEVHCRRLGQTGEHIALAQRFITRRVWRALQGCTFPVPAPEERVIVATLQRMYRHFYFRLSDILNTAALLDSGELDFAELRAGAELGGIWPGVATYLKLVCDYVGRYRSQRPPLPQDVMAAARFDGASMQVRHCFIRIPIMPHGARLYTAQVRHTALRGDVPATFRLTLLPPLASVAAVAYKLTGSDKGIW